MQFKINISFFKRIIMTLNLAQIISSIMNLLLVSLIYNSNDNIKTIFLVLSIFILGIDSYDAYLLYQLNQQTTRLFVFSWLSHILQSEIFIYMAQINTNSTYFILIFCNQNFLITYYTLLQENAQFKHQKMVQLISQYDYMISLVMFLYKILRIAFVNEVKIDLLILVLLQNILIYLICFQLKNQNQLKKQQENNERVNDLNFLEVKNIDSDNNEIPNQKLSQCQEIYQQEQQQVKQLVSFSIPQEEIQSKQYIKQQQRSQSNIEIRSFKLGDSLNSLFLNSSQSAKNEFKKQSEQLINKQHINSFMLYDIFPEGICILEKNVSYSTPNKFNIVYLNNSVQSIFETKDIQQILDQILSLQDYKQNQSTQLNVFNQMSINSFKSAQFFNSSNFLQNQQNQNSQYCIQKKKINYNDNQTSILINSKDHSHQDDQNMFCLGYQLNEMWTNLLKVGGQHLPTNEFQFYQFIDSFISYIQQNPNKERRCLEVRCFSSFQNKTPMILVILRDVTHRDYIKKLQEHSSLKSQTISFVSHEFRTPLNCIISILSWLLESYNQCKFCNEENSKYLKSAQVNANFLLNLSNDLLDFAQLKSEMFDIKNMVESCVDMFKVLADKKNINLSFFIDEGTPQQIEQDRNRIKQVLINLLGNAFKFVLKGSIQVIVQKLENEKSIKVCVKDTGIGIKEEDIPKLIKAFGKLEDEQSKKLNSSGVGLGLMISQKIVYQLNHRNQQGLFFESKYNLDYDNYSQTSISQLQEDEYYDNEDSFYNLKHKMNKISDFSNQKKFIRSLKQISSEKCTCNQILIVDDNQFNIDALTIMLKQIGIEKIDYTIAGQLAEEKVKERYEKAKCVSCRSYKIIFMDIEMPGQDGIKTSVNIDSFYRKMNMKCSIIACSGYCSEKEKQKCLKSGCINEYITKPVCKKQLKQLIEQYL